MFHQVVSSVHSCAYNLSLHFIDFVSAAADYNFIELSQLTH